MQKSATLNLRIDPEVKQSAESVLSQLGLSISAAVDLFLRQISLTGSIPFRVALPEAPRSVDSNAMSDEELRTAFMKGYQEAIKGDVVPAVSLLSALHSEFFDA